MLRAFALASLFLLPLCLRGADAVELIKELGSDNEKERAAAAEGLQKLGEAARAPLLNADRDGENLKPRQSLLVRRLLGNLLVAQTPLKLVDLNQVAPFGSDKEKGIQGDPNLLFNRDTKTIVMNGEFVLERGPLEFLICEKNPSAPLHETVIGVYCRPRDLCYVLLACPYTFAGELSDDGVINLPPDAGVKISVEFEWEAPNSGTKTWVRVPLQYFAWNPETETTMRQAPFAFTGSKFEKNPDTGKMEFAVDMIVALRPDAYAILNNMLDTRTVDPPRDRFRSQSIYDVNRFIVPARGTKCRVVFEPWTGKVASEDLKDTAPQPRGGEPPAVPPPGAAAPAPETK